MTNILDLKPNIIVGENYQSVLTLNSWKGFQSRQGDYGKQDKEEQSDGTVKVTLKGIEVDYVKVSSQEQINAVKYLTENAEKVRNTLLEGILKEFPKLKEIYEDYLPEVSSIEQFKEHIGLTYLHIMQADKDDFAYIGFELGCTWDEEHGVGVMMHKDRVVAVGLAETSFDSWVTFADNGTTEIETKRWNEANAKIQNERMGEKKEKKWWKFW